MARRHGNFSPRAVRLIAVALTLTLLGSAPALAGHSGNDAGSGRDAPDGMEGAMNIPLGTFTGATGGSDDADWYRVRVDPDTRIEFTLEATGDESMLLLAYGDTGEYLDGKRAWRSNSEPARLTLFKAGEEHIRFSISAPDWRPSFDSYRFSISMHEIPDVRVDDVTVRGDGAVDGFLGSAGGEQREVDVTVSNPGPGSAPSTGLQVWVRPATTSPTTQSRIIADVEFTLAPGEVRTLTIPWDTAGQLGGARVGARVDHQWDNDTANNYADDTTSVTLPYEGVGLDLFSHVIRGPFTGIGRPVAESSWDADRKGLEVTAPFLAAAVDAGPDNGGTEACVTDVCQPA